MVYASSVNYYILVSVSVADLRKKAQVANVLGHPVYITELQINLRACGLKIMENKGNIVFG